MVRAPLTLAALMLVVGCTENDGPVGRTFLIGRRDTASTPGCPAYRQDSGVHQMRVEDFGLLLDDSVERVPATVVDRRADEAYGDAPNISFTSTEHWYAGPGESFDPQFPRVDWTLWANGGTLAGHATTTFLDTTTSMTCVYAFDVTGEEYAE